MEGKRIIILSLGFHRDCYTIEMNPPNYIPKKRIIGLHMTIPEIAMKLNEIYGKQGNIIYSSPDQPWYIEEINNLLNSEIKMNSYEVIPRKLDPVQIIQYAKSSAVVWRGRPKYREYSLQAVIGIHLHQIKTRFDEQGKMNG